MGRSLFQRSPIDCCVSGCDREASIMKRPWPTKDSCALGKNNADLHSEPVHSLGFGIHQWFNVDLFQKNYSVFQRCKRVELQTSVIHFMYLYLIYWWGHAVA